MLLVLQIPPREGGDVRIEALFGRYKNGNTARLNPSPKCSLWVPLTVGIALGGGGLSVI